MLYACAPAVCFPGSIMYDKLGLDPHNAVRRTRAGGFKSTSLVRQSTKQRAGQCWKWHICVVTPACLTCSNKLSMKGRCI